MASCEYVSPGRPINLISSAALSLLPSSEVVSSEEFHTSHRYHPELSGGGCQTLNLDLVLCRKDRQAPSTFGIIYRAVTHDRTNFGQVLKVVAVSLHDVFLAVGHRLYEVRARQDHFAQEVGHLLPLVADAASRVVTSIIDWPHASHQSKNTAGRRSFR